MEVICLKCYFLEVFPILVSRFHCLILAILFNTHGILKITVQFFSEIFINYMYQIHEYSIRTAASSKRLYSNIQVCTKIRSSLVKASAVFHCLQKNGYPIRKFSTTSVKTFSTSNKWTGRFFISIWHKLKISTKYRSWSLARQTEIHSASGGAFFLSFLLFFKFFYLLSQDVHIHSSLSVLPKPICFPTWPHGT